MNIKLEKKRYCSYQWH